MNIKKELENTLEEIKEELQQRTYNHEQYGILLIAKAKVLVALQKYEN
ncbi:MULTISPECIES: hypothetical protein [Bacillus cereus group]|uniref:Phage protein n=1 Tax=Bacillus cereus HuA3-9 TaxID=1053205 RepID=R8CIK9_BACCE|nr:MULTISPECIES: hypothetical protein [Bacillus cereus group]EOO11345.1 hypothetical protein IGA_05608 [Bacillus cereus HuA3-9]